MRPSDLRQLDGFPQLSCLYRHRNKVYGWYELVVMLERQAKSVGHNLTAIGHRIFGLMQGGVPECNIPAGLPSDYRE